MNKRNVNLQIFLALALVSEITYIVIASIDRLRLNIPVYLSCYAIVFAIYWIAALFYFDFRSSTQFGTKDNSPGLVPEPKRLRWLSQFIKKQKIQESLSTKEVLIVGIIFGVFFRLTLLFSPPSLSDDIFRYVWDGRVAAHGINPFQYPPNADELSALRDNVIYPNINHKEISTIYPPINQIMFLGIYKLNPSVLTFKAAFLVFDLLTILVLFLVLKSLSINMSRLLLYVWNPLIIVEITGNGHADIFGIFLLTLALWLLIKNRSMSSTCVLALSFLTKYLSLIFLPFVAFFKKDYKIIIGLVFIIIAAVFYLPYAGAGDKLFSGLFVYSSKWRFNDSIFAVVFSTVKSLLPENWIVDLMIKPQGLSPEPATIASRGTDLALSISKFIVGAIYSGVFVYYLLRFKKNLTQAGNIWVFKTGLIVLGTLFLLSPTVHPWYFCWLLPFLVIVPNRAWILLTGLVGLSYWIFIDYAKLGVWEESLWVKWLEYLPFYLLLIYDGLAHRFTRK
jgi:predicted secreted protein